MLGSWLSTVRRNSVGSWRSRGRSKRWRRPVKYSSIEWFDCGTGYRRHHTGCRYDRCRNGGTQCRSTPLDTGYRTMSKPRPDTSIKSAMTYGTRLATRRPSMGMNPASAGGQIAGRAKLVNSGRSIGREAIGARKDTQLLNGFWLIVLGSTNVNGFADSFVVFESGS